MLSPGFMAEYINRSSSVAICPTPQPVVYTGTDLLLPIHRVCITRRFEQHRSGWLPVGDHGLQQQAQQLAEQKSMYRNNLAHSFASHCTFRQPP